MNKVKFFAAGLLLFAATSFLSSCGDSDDTTPQSQVSLTYSVPEGLKTGKVTGTKVTFYNVNTGRLTEYPLDGSTTITVDDGLYNITLVGQLTYEVNGKTITSHLRAVKNAVSVSGGKVAISLAAEVVSVKQGFVFAEIFVSGTKTPDGDSYESDKYFRIYNNSDETLYADGLVLFESAFTNDDPHNYTPNLRDKAFTIDVAYMVPGTGKEHPVAPGKSILLVDVGLDHTKNNKNSFNLAKADFEWYDASEDGADTDTDVPNLIKLITTMDGESVGLWAPHGRGVKTYAIGYLGDDNKVSVKQFLTDYVYKYSYKFVYEGLSVDMDNTGFMVPNSWIADCVNMRPQKTVQAWLCASSALDAGFAYNSVQEDDQSRYGKAVRRKFDKKTGKLIDTNNSTNDFESMVKANPYYIFK